MLRTYYDWLVHGGVVYVGDNVFAFSMRDLMIIGNIVDDYVGSLHEV